MRGVAVRRPLRALGDWVAAPAPAERLAVLRILTGVFATVYVAVRSPVFFGLANRDRGAFEPVGQPLARRDQLRAQRLAGRIG